MDKERKKKIGCSSSTTLEHVSRELHERHPTACGNVNSANDLDLGLVDTMRPDSPSGVDRVVRVTVHTMLKRPD